MVKITIKKSDIQSGSEEEEHDSSSAEVVFIELDLLHA